MSAPIYNSAIDYYEDRAAVFAERYNSVSFDDIYPDLKQYLPKSGRVLDVGAGSGRDAIALAGRGLSVVAVEPSKAFRDIGMAHSSEVIEWIDDRLPLLDRLDRIAGPFDFILCSAVLMLLDRKGVELSFLRLVELLSPNGRVAISLRAAMPNEPKDIFYSHSDANLMEMAAAAGLVCLERTEREDSLGRHGYRWVNYVFEHI